MPQVASERDVLDRVTVRLVAAEELGRFNHHLQENHYLASRRLVGRALRYVAELDGQWVALLTFSASALHLKAREQWIGWTPRQRARWLGLVVNNSRFLVRPQRQRYPNLASQVLGLALRRLSTVERHSQNQQAPKENASLDTGYYATSLAVQEHDGPRCWR